MNLLEQYGLTERLSALAAEYPMYALARVTAQHRGLYTLAREDGELQAEISGKFRHETRELAQFPTVGDFVMTEKEAFGGRTVIHRLLPRKSLFLRRAVGVKGQAQCVAANIDTVFICMSLNRNYNLNRLERYLSVAWDSGAVPVVLLTKADLCDDLPAAESSAAQAASFCEVISLSVYDDTVEQKLAKYLQPGMTAAFIGSSGVGKSTLINRLLGEDRLAAAAVDKADKGRHTTTGREMFCCPFGGVLIDTPGMRELGAESADLSKAFDDVEELAGRCRFHDCTHTNEPGCAVQAALADGSLDRRRYENYCRLKVETGYEGLSSRAIETKKMERMLQDVGGMKNRRKFLKEHLKYKK